MTANDVVRNIESLTTKSSSIIPSAQQLSAFNAPLLLVGQGPWPKVILGFTDIVTTATGYITSMSAGPGVLPGEPYPGAEAAAIAEAFREFVSVHQDLLNILIGQGGFMSQIPFVGPPVAAVLRAVESVVDTIAFSLIDNVEETAAAAMRTDAAALSGTIDEAIAAFDGR